MFHSATFSTAPFAKEPLFPVRLPITVLASMKTYRFQLFWAVVPLTSSGCVDQTHYLLLQEVPGPRSDQSQSVVGENVDIPTRVEQSRETFSWANS